MIGACIVDLLDVPAAREYFTERGISIDSVIADGARVASASPDGVALLFRLPRRERRALRAVTLSNKGRKVAHFRTVTLSSGGWS